jgi:hypothetical protein
MFSGSLSFFLSIHRFSIHPDSGDRNHTAKRHAIGTLIAQKSLES